MKLSSREARAFLRAPRPGIAAALITGEDAARVALARGDLVAAWAGPGAEAEMRIDRLAAAEIRRNPALLPDAVKARGFFPGTRVVVLDEATDGLAPALQTALEGWSAGDAHLVVAGAGLPARGALRRLFEAARHAVVIALYDDPPDPAEIEALLREADLHPDPEAYEAILAAAQSLPPGEFRGLLEKLSLYQSAGTEPLTAEAVAALAPATGEAGMEDLLLALSEGRKDRVPTLLARLSARGGAPVAVAIALARHWRAALLVKAARRRRGRACRPASPGRGDPASGDPARCGLAARSAGGGAAADRGSRSRAARRIHGAAGGLAGADAAQAGGAARSLIPGLP
ncbi:DNA polymerase III, delta subunit [Rubellimicrobium thermophilum DSM 16684]|uniref:DNA polymerase III, delta subunit n=1 Tax=Rubellimicrobium thermophilum DSM 16684 TaxID=1123069 RepID=S9QMK7_9RHOB|nr:hypothetical protein [Rubellimicrobium thermophilum]EPX82676.1 DNA polymerase III, delta subunit [Rubellimicrobium thermophilum DSM 16684]